MINIISAILNKKVKKAQWIPGMPASDPKMSSTIEWWLTEERAHTKQRYRYFSKLVTSSLVQYSKTSPTWLQLQLGAIYLGQYFWLGIQSACTKK